MSHSNAKSALLICLTVANTRQRITPCCSPLTPLQTAEDIYRLYRLRFQIEFIFRDAKQFTGLSDGLARDAKKLDFHFNASFTALNLAQLDMHRQHPGHQPFVFSMASVKRRALNDHLLDIFISRLDLEPTLIKSHPNYQSLRAYGTIAA